MDGTINTLRRIASLGTLVGTEVLGLRGADYREEEEEETAGGRLTLSGWILILSLTRWKSKSRYNQHISHNYLLWHVGPLNTA